MGRGIFRLFPTPGVSPLVNESKKSHIVSNVARVRDATKKISEGPSGWYLRAGGGGWVAEPIMLIASGGRDVKPGTEVYLDLRELLGQGGYGKVYKGKLLGKTVAIKLQITKDPLSEARVMLNLEHPNVIRLLAYGETGAREFLVFPLCECSLTDLIGKMCADIITTKKVVKGLLSGLHYLQDIMNILHGDIKPGNILVSSEEGVKFADFGTAQVLDPNAPAKVTAGTVNYMSPERMARREYRFPSDVWATGVVISEVVLGYTPAISRSTIRRMQDQMLSLLPKLARICDLSETLLEILTGLLEPTEKKRMSVQKALELAAKLE